MKKRASLCVLFTLGSVLQLIVAQQPFQEDLYIPMPLQSYTPPKDANFRENKLIVFNMLEHKFDTVYSAKNYSNAEEKISSSGNNTLSESNFKGKNREYIFSNIAPADQLVEFPNYPMSGIVKLFLTFFNPVNNQTNFATCSGLMIHPGFILTGGHCVKSKFDSSYAISCTVIPAYNLGKRPYGLTTTTNWYSFTQWTQNGNLDYDIAIMSLSNPIGNQTGWIDLGYQPNDSFFISASNVFYSFGYPGYDPIGNPVFEEGERMYYMFGNMDFLKSKNSICHNNIGYQGQSGSGLFHQDSANNRKAYGVLSHGNLFPPYHTCHCRMDSSMFAYFKSIISNVSQSLNNSSIQQIAVYPNPTSGHLHFDFSKIQFHTMKLQIFDLVGRKIVNEICPQNKSSFSIDLTPFPSGNYLIMAEIDGKRINGRIVKTE